MTLPYINDYKGMRESINLQCMARFKPTLFNLDPGFVPGNDTEKFCLQTLRKYHDPKLWQTKTKK